MNRIGKILFLSLFFIFSCAKKEKSDNVPNTCKEITINHSVCLYLYDNSLNVYLPEIKGKDSLNLDDVYTSYSKLIDEIYNKGWKYDEIF